MTEKPVVTIGIPFFNEENYLREAIDSVINQSYPNIQIILSDNCSTDSSFEIAKEYAKCHSQISLHRQNENIGAFENFKFVLEMANTKYFAWLGGHDLFHKEYVEKAVQFLEMNDGYVMAYPGGIFINAEGRQLSDICDDYDTSGMSPKDSVQKIVGKFYNGYVIHGLFRTEVLKKSRLLQVIAPDLLVLVSVSLYGNIYRIPSVGISRRMVRQETPEQQLKRHEEEGVFKKRKGNPFAKLYLEILKEIIRSNKIGLKDKIKTVRILRMTFRYKFLVSWKQILSAIWNASA